MTHRVDVAIIGSGFAGSLLAWILVRRGYRVALIDQQIHPRFAIGESSTPIADSILRRLGEVHDLPPLRALSAWGSWQHAHPEIACGRKRGFSYFVHREGKGWNEDQAGDASLLVAASSSDEVADTHWYRPDVDAFFWRQATQSGAIDLTGCRAQCVESLPDRRFAVECVGRLHANVACEWIIDASGQSAVLARQSGSPNLAGQLRTRTHTTFAHLTGVDSWDAVASRPTQGSIVDPFHPDDAAQHHLVDGGWVWMLRFNNGNTSLGYTAPLDRPLMSLERVATLYPSLAKMLVNARHVAPASGPVRSERLQRWFDPVVDSRRLMLPTSALTLDPLHSTGIAHGLAGVERLIGVITAELEQERIERIEDYRLSLMEETSLLDRLVSTAYATMADFERFTIACMLYFAGAIRCEERYQRGETPTHLWNADDPEFVAFVDWACQQLLQSEAGFTDSIRQRLEPWNSAGLMNPECGNRYAYSATKR